LDKSKKAGTSPKGANRVPGMGRKGKKATDDAARTGGKREVIFQNILEKI
jgi:hypothetical protein